MGLVGSTEKKAAQPSIAGALAELGKNLLPPLVLRKEILRLSITDDGLQRFVYNILIL